MAKKTSKTIKALSKNYIDKLENELQSNQSKVSLVLGALIVLVVGILVFNYFNKNKAALGPAQQTQQAEQKDVTPDQLPGAYTVKEGDTLFTISKTYYQDGYKFTEIAKANNLENPDLVETGQVLQIPKTETQQALVSPQPTQETLGTGGGNSTIWGDKIDGNTYTVGAYDWLSKIAGRAYGDVMAYQKIAAANNITDPDLIEPGTVLTIPR